MIRQLAQKAITICFGYLRRRFPVAYWVAAADALQGTVVEVTPDSGPLAMGAGSLRLPVDGSIFPYVMAKGSWQLKDLENALRELTPGHEYSLIDVGANIGLFSRQVTAMSASIGTVWCFEPAPSNFACLVHNLRHLGDRAQLFNTAIDDRSGAQTFYKDKDNIGNYSLNADAVEGRRFETTTVQTMAAADAWERIRSGINGRLIWKSDTQGHDEKIMTFFPPEMWNRVDVAILEIWQIRKPAVDWKKLSEILDSFPIKIFSSHPDRPLSTQEIIEFARGGSGAIEDLVLSRTRKK